MLRCNSVEIGPPADVSHNISDIFMSLPPADEEDSAARGAEELLSFKSHQVRKVLLWVMIHQNQAEPLTGHFISSQMGMQFWNGLG